MWTVLDWSDVGKLAAWALTTVGASFAGSYFGSYLKKKGENLATHEDIDKVVDQVRAVTQATKEIPLSVASYRLSAQTTAAVLRAVAVLQPDNAF